MTRRSLNQPPLDGRDFRRLLDGQLTERDWQKQVEDALTIFGWWWMHVPPNVVVCPRCRTKIYRGIRKGMPDILAIKPPFIVWIELKTEVGHLKREQRQMRSMLEACGQTFIHARPRDRVELFDLIAQPELKADEWRARAPQTRASVKV